MLKIKRMMPWWVFFRIRWWSAETAAAATAGWASWRCGRGAGRGRGSAGARGCRTRWSPGLLSRNNTIFIPSSFCRRATTRTVPRPAARTAACWTPPCHTHPAPPTPATSATPTPASGYSRTRQSGQQLCFAFSKKFELSQYYFKSSLKIQAKVRKRSGTLYCLIMGSIFCVGSVQSLDRASEQISSLDPGHHPLTQLKTNVLMSSCLLFPVPPQTQSHDTVTRPRLSTQQTDGG